MAEPFLAEIRIMSFNFPPKGWALCNGQLLPINQNQALFSLLGTMYGGNGQTNFALPDLRGRIPIDRGNGHTQGEVGGSSSVTVNIQQLPQHTHALLGSNANGAVSDPTNNYLAQFNNGYSSAISTLTPLQPSAVSSVGGSQPHDNMQPYQVINFCI